MAGNTKILVFKLKELIYTGIFILLGILLIILFICMFNDNSKKPSDKNPDTTASSGEVNAVPTDDENTSTDENSATKDSNNGGITSDNTQTTSDSQISDYKDGVYISSLVLNNGTVDIEITIKDKKFTNISIKKMDQDVKSMYPLIESAVEDISSQVISSQSLENITYPADCKYTYLIILDSIKAGLK